ncbi:MAG: hypothetical protein FWC16_05985 [Defluviitaleaceae bacterium]|nr:hypothetical protein [Defluviitaleaceae bacterium]MCL2274458.1 hypothetical protein [Defluviitaleaceae bacterium]
MKIYLGYWSINREVKELVYGDKISLHTLDNIERKLNSIEGFMLHCSYFNMMYDNLAEVVKCIQCYEDCLALAKTEVELLSYFPKINRYFMNLLGSFHVYVDRHDQHQRKVGEIGSNPKVFWNKDPNRRSSKFYDKYWIYRFFYKLRNFAVHCSMPITSNMNYEGSSWRHFIIEKKHLINNNSFDWGSLKYEFFEEYDLKQCLNQFQVMIIEFHAEVISTMYNSVTHTIEYFDCFAKEVIFDNNKYRVLPNVITDLGDGNVKIDPSIGINVHIALEYLEKLAAVLPKK